MQIEAATNENPMGRGSHKLIPSDRVEGTPVRRLNGERIGTVKRLMIDKITGQVAYAVLNFGGFLGLGQKHYPITWSRLKYDPDIGAYQVDLSDVDLDAAGLGADDCDWGERDDPIVVSNYHHKPTYWGAF